MKFNLSALLVVLFLSLGGNTYSQTNTYQEADTLARQANDELQKGNVKSADLLIRKSIEAYPVFAVFNYAKSLAKLSDVAGANIIMDKVVERVVSFPGTTILTSEPNAFMEMYVKGSVKPKEYEKNRAHFNFLAKVYDVNKAYGDRKSILKCLQDLQLPVIKEKTGGWAPGEAQVDMEYIMQQAYLSVKLLYDGDFDKLIENLENRKPGKYTTKESHLFEKIGYLTAKGDYEMALKEIEILKKNKLYIPAGNLQLFNVYTAMGDSRAMSYYDQIVPEIKETNTTYFSLAKLKLAEKDYQAALKNLEISTGLRNKVIVSDMLIENWELFKAYGDAYSGLKQYDKAKDNYRISLLYHPEFKPAVEALAKLEVAYVQEVFTDKTAPVISITEPASTRGLKVSVAENSVMVKGTADDPSGLKEVSINGKKVFSQNGGNFWGDVVLGDGLNKVTIVATDLAGNKAEQTFEIEKRASAIVVANTAIIPVAEKEGKNYALFVAAQNYTDSAIPSLENPVADAVKLKLILKNNYNFADANLISLFNPESNDLSRKLLELTNLLQPEDNLVIFYAGHGIWVDKEKKGYWLLTDAKRNDSNTWLPNRDVLDLIAKIPARHTLLITDACFSGSVFKTRGLDAGAPTALKEMDNKISRIAITSGNDTEVPDESIFMKYLVKALSENKEKYLTAQKMFINQIIEAVMAESKTEPRYGTLELAGHVGGDFIFTKK